MKKKTLLNKTIDLIHQSDVPVAQMCRDLELTERWVYKVMSGDISDPGVNRVQRVHDYLIKRKAA